MSSRGGHKCFRREYIETHADQPATRNMVVPCQDSPISAEHRLLHALHLINNERFKRSFTKRSMRTKKREPPPGGDYKRLLMMLFWRPLSLLLPSKVVAQSVQKYPKFHTSENPCCSFLSNSPFWIGLTTTASVSTLDVFQITSPPKKLGRCCAVFGLRLKVDDSITALQASAKMDPPQINELILQPRTSTRW